MMVTTQHQRRKYEGREFESRQHHLFREISVEDCFEHLYFGNLHFIGARCIILIYLVSTCGMCPESE